MILPRKLYHYSKESANDLKQDFSYEMRTSVYMEEKPNGLWFSVEDFEGDQTWPSWCRAEKFNIEGLKYKYLIKLKENTNILYLNSAEEVMQFSLNYKKGESDMIANLFRCANKTQWVSRINWPLVIAKYDGIIIAPYQWNCRLDVATHWYYGWDCASGCIWNIDVIESFILESANEEAFEPELV